MLYLAFLQVTDHHMSIQYKFMGFLWSSCFSLFIYQFCMTAYQHILTRIFFRLGQIENARHHLCFPGQHSDPTELHKLQIFEKHLNQFAVSRKIGDWKSMLRETDAAIAIGADSSP